MLREMAEIGMGLLRIVERHAATSTADSVGELGLTYARVSRAVRQTLALRAKFAEDRLAKHRRAEAEEARRAQEAEQHRLDCRSDQVERLVEQAIETEVEQSDREDLRAGLLADLRERLSDDYIEVDLYHRPIGELLARICRDIGITPDPDQWAGAVWVDEAEAAAARVSQTRQLETAPADSPPAGSAGGGHDPPPGGDG